MERKPDNRPDLCVSGLAARQWGVLSLAELAKCGLSPSSVRVRVRKGWLHRLHRGVYAVGHPNPGVEGRFLAAVKACGPTARLSHYSAGSLFGFVEWDDRRPEVTVIGTAPRSHTRVCVHRTGVLDVRDVARHKGIPVTSPARTLIDLASQLSYHALLRAVRKAQALNGSRWRSSPTHCLGLVRATGGATWPG